VLEKGAGEGVVYRRIKPYIESGDPSGLRFTIINALKDIGYYNTMAKDVSAHHEIAAGIFKSYEIAVEGGNAQRLVPELVSVLSRA